ncbi:hypothetical protein B0H14DRAFT_2503648 [Mycena olivaceomarginata]|nr:hypothetical protein B0H14DRAFT_2503648 [Mycena olivaceomarginata]
MDVHHVARSESRSSEGSVGNARRRKREPSSIGYSAHSSRSRRQSPQRPDGTSPASPTRAHTPIPYSSARQSSIASMNLGTRSSSSRSRSPQRPKTSTSSPMRQRPISAPRPISPRPLPQTQRTGPYSTRPYSAVPPPPIPYPHRDSEKVDSSALELPPPATSVIKYSKSSPLGMFIFIVPVALFLFDFVPRQLYLHLLLRIPSLYFSRVTRIFEDAQLSLPDIKRMARANADQWNTSENAIWQLSTQTPDQMPLPRSLLHFRSSWESFIDSLMREWKTFNIISVLLMSAILTMLQIEAASHPIIRTSALFSLICALMSLLYGCMYIIRFGTMRKMHKASSLATEAQKGTTSIWWNIWVLLAMPAVWLAWSIIMFLTCIMSFIWLSGSSQDPVDFVLSPRAALGPRIALTVVFFLGVIYFGLIVRTFHRYGDPLDREWMRVVNEWMKDTLDPRQNPYSAQQPSSGPFNRSFQSATRDGVTSKFRHAYQTQAAAPLVRALAEEGFPAAPPEPLTKLSPSAPLTSRPSAFLKTPHPAASQPVIPFIVMQLGHRHVEARITGHADPTWSGAIDADDWTRFILDISSAWHGQLSLTRPQAGTTSTDLPAYTLLSLPRRPNPAPDSVHTVCDFIDLWNELYFYPRYLEASLVVQHDSSGPTFAVNLAALSFTSFFKQRKYHMAPMIIGSSS